MARSTTYYTLIGSLPALPWHFEEAERVPISRLSLMERLKMLQPHDAHVIEEMTDFLAWGGFPNECPIADPTEDERGIYAPPHRRGRHEIKA